MLCVCVCVFGAVMTNEIDLRVDRGEYVGGDTIYG